ncbi:MAG: sugar ABC transporter substrate-binding protein, partial [Spirochaeta sp.]
MIILLLSGVSILLFTVVVLQQLKMRRVAALQSDITGCITNAVQTLEHGLSAFSSGDMTIQLPDPVCLPKSSTGKALYRGVSDCIEDFQSITAVPARRICFSGANSYQEGVLAGQRIAEAMNSKGTVASFIPLFTQINHVMRMKGCLDYLAAQHPNIQSIGVFESQGNQDAARIAYQSMVKKHGQVDMLYITDGHTPAAFVEQIKEDKHRNTRVIAFDAIPENVALLKQGKIECLVEQNSFAQSYNALIHLYNHCESSWKPVLPKLFMKPLAIDRDNYTTYWDDARNERIMKDEELAMLAEPVRNTSGRTYRFGLILPLSTGFFAG